MGRFMAYCTISCKRNKLAADACRQRSNIRADSLGVAALEFALVAPILLLMILGMMCFGLYFTYIHEVEEIAGAAARSSVAGLNPAERDSLTRAFVTTAATNSSFLRPTDISVNTATSGSPAITYAVTVGYSLNNTPIPMLSALIGAPTTNISRTSTVQFGGY